MKIEVTEYQLQILREATENWRFFNAKNVDKPAYDGLIVLLKLAAEQQQTQGDQND